MELAAYSAIAGVAAITTGVQVAISVSATVMTWTDVDDSFGVGLVGTGRATQQKGMLRALFALAVIAFVAVVNGSALLGWVLETPSDVSLGLKLPMVGVLLVWLGCVLAGLWAAARSIRHFR